MGSSNKRAVNVDLMLDFMVNLRTSLVSLELDWGNENLVLRRSKRASSQLHRSPLSHSFYTSTILSSSVADPDQNVFGTPRSGSVSTRYRYESFYHYAKIVRKT